MLLARRAGPANCNAATSLHCCFRMNRKCTRRKALCSMVVTRPRRTKYCFLKKLDQVKWASSQVWRLTDSWNITCNGHNFASMPMQHFQLLRMANAHTYVEARNQQVLVIRYQEPQGSLVPVVGVWFGKLYLIRSETAAMVAAKKRILLSWNVWSYSLIMSHPSLVFVYSNHGWPFYASARWIIYLGWFHYMSQLYLLVVASKSHTRHPEASSYQNAFMLVIACSLMLRYSCWHGSDSQLL